MKGYYNFLMRFSLVMGVFLVVAAFVQVLAGTPGAMKYWDLFLGLWNLHTANTCKTRLEELENSNEKNDKNI